MFTDSIFVILGFNFGELDLEVNRKCIKDGDSQVDSFRLLEKSEWD